MLCRHLKPPRPYTSELTNSFVGYGFLWDFWCNAGAEISNKKCALENPIKADVISRTFEKVGKGAFFSLCLVAFHLSAQTLNAVQLASVSKEIEPAKVSTPVSNASTQLQNEARNWLAQELSLKTEEVQISDMDARLKFQPCTFGVVFDHPFANRQVIRARCEAPNWQFFLKATFSDEKTALKASRVNVNVVSTKEVTSNSGNANLAQKAPSALHLASNVNTSIPGSKMKMVLVANQPLRRGTILQASQFKQIEMAVALTDSMVLSQFKEIENSELLHDMGAEQAIRNYDIKPTLLVKKGQQVNFSIGEGRGFLITIKTEAQQDGALGDQIKLKNVESGRLISGVITGLNEARAL